MTFKIEIFWSIPWLLFAMLATIGFLNSRMEWKLSFWFQIYQGIRFTKVTTCSYEAYYRPLLVQYCSVQSCVARRELFIKTLLSLFVPFRNLSVCLCSSASSFCFPCKSFFTFFNSVTFRQRYKQLRNHIIFHQVCYWRFQLSGRCPSNSIKCFCIDVPSSKLNLTSCFLITVW